MYSAIQHFNPRIRSSVISSYEASYNSQSNAKIKEYTDTIERCKTEIAAIDTRIEELDSEIESARARKTEKSEEIKLYAEGEELQDKKEKLLKKIAVTERSKATIYKMISKDFNGSLSSFFSISLVERALQLLSEKDFAGKDIPYMHAKTIEYLLRQKCVYVVLVWMREQ